MGLLDIDSVDTTDRQGSTSPGYTESQRTEDAYVIPSEQTDTVEYVCDFAKWYGLYKNIPMLKSVIDKMAIWTVGKGYKAKPSTKKVLDRIRGNGKQTFNGILNNGVRIYKMCGDFYAEIIKDFWGRLVNLKPLNPGSIKITANKFAIIKKYDQLDNKGAIIGDGWKPKEIFHLMNLPVADGINGIPTTEKLQSVIKKWHLSMDDLSVVFHRYVKPLLITYVETDDDEEIARFKTKQDKMWRDMENMIAPKDTVEKIERVSIPQYSTLDPLPWIQFLQSYFILTEGVPETILGHSTETSEATAKIIYLAFQQTIEWEQLYIEEQVKAQLGLEINLEFPASIDPSLLTDARKNTGDSVKKLSPTDESKT